MGEQEVCGVGRRDGVVNARRRGCGSGSLWLSSPGGFRSQLSPCYISPYSQPRCKQVTGTERVTCHLS